MAVNTNVLDGAASTALAGSLRPAADRRLFLIAAIGFPLLILIGYAKTYYFSSFFSGVKPLANPLVHAHGLVMSAWVIFFSVQALLIRTKNVKLHMSLGIVGVALAALVVVVGMSTAVDSHLVRKTAPPGISPYGFFAVAVFDMVNFVILFAAAIWYRKRPAEHKSLMLLTAINFLPAAIFRIPILPPDYLILQAFGIPDLLALSGFAWYTWKHRKFNKIFASGIALIIATQPLRIFLAGSPIWIEIMASLAGQIEELHVHSPPPMPW